MFVDRVGKRRFFIIVTCSLFVVSCLLFGVLEAGTETEPNWWSCIPLVLLGTPQTKTLGLSFAFYSCVVIPAVQYVVEERVMGTAFGLMGSLESVALACFPLIAASIVEAAETKEDGYSRVGYFFAGMSTRSIIN
jgi:MFS family permease